MLPIVKTGLSATNPAVRLSTLTLAGVIHLFVGDLIRNLLSDEKPATIQLLNTQFTNNEGQKPPPPTRFTITSKLKSVSENEVGDLGDAVPAEDEPEEIDLEASLPRVDIRLVSKF